MYNDVFEQWMKNSKNMSMPFYGYNKATTDMFQRLIQQNLEMMSDSLVRTTDQLKRLSHVKKPEEFYNFQKEFVTENISAAVENMQQILRTTTDNAETFNDLYSSSHDQQTSGARSPEKSTR